MLGIFKYLDGCGGDSDADAKPVVTILGPKVVMDYNTYTIGMEFRKTWEDVCAQLNWREGQTKPTELYKFSATTDPKDKCNMGKLGQEELPQCKEAEVTWSIAEVETPREELASVLSETWVPKLMLEINQEGKLWFKGLQKTDVKDLYGTNGGRLDPDVARRDVSNVGWKINVTASAKDAKAVTIPVTIYVR